MMSARCLWMGSSVVVRAGGGLDDGDSTNMDEEEVSMGRDSDVAVGKGAVVVEGDMVLLNDD